MNTFLNFQPKPGATATHYFGIAMDILNSLDTNLTHEQFKENLALEYTYKAAAPHITSLRALRLSSPHEYVTELDQYVVARQMESDHLWRYKQPKQPPHWTQKSDQLQILLLLN